MSITHPSLYNEVYCFVGLTLQAWHCIIQPENRLLIGRKGFGVVKIARTLAKTVLIGVKVNRRQKRATFQTSGNASLNKTLSPALPVALLRSHWRPHGVLLRDHDVCAARLPDLLAAGGDGLLLPEDLQVRWAGAGFGVRPPASSHPVGQISLNLAVGEISGRLYRRSRVGSCPKSRAGSGNFSDDWEGKSVAQADF